MTFEYTSEQQLAATRGRQVADHIAPDAARMDIDGAFPDSAWRGVSEAMLGDPFGAGAVAAVVALEEIAVQSEFRRSVVARTSRCRRCPAAG
jgi:hypothetical protein